MAAAVNESGNVGWVKEDFRAHLALPDCDPPNIPSFLVFSDGLFADAQPCGDFPTRQQGRVVAYQIALPERGAAGHGFGSLAAVSTACRASSIGLHSAAS